MNGRARARGGFSLIELVIVVVIIGIIGAVAIPRMSRGAAGAADSSLTANLTRLRNAIDLFHAEHASVYPKLATFSDQMTLYSSEPGATSATKDSTYFLGPYLRSIPALPVGADKGKTSLVATYTAGNGWVYNENTGVISANCPDGETDARGVKYNSY